MDFKEAALLCNFLAKDYARDFFALLVGEALSVGAGRRDEQGGRRAEGGQAEVFHHLSFDSRQRFYLGGYR